jgi:hypothetical protein
MIGRVYVGVSHRGILKQPLSHDGKRRVGPPVDPERDSFSREAAFLASSIRLKQLLLLRCKIRGMAALRMWNRCACEGVVSKKLDERMIDYGKA